MQLDSAKAVSPEGRRKAISFLGWTGGGCAGRTPIPQRVALGRGRAAVGCCTVEAELRGTFGCSLVAGDLGIPGGCPGFAWPTVTSRSSEVAAGRGAVLGLGAGGCRGAFLVSNSWPKQLRQCPGAGRPSLQGHQASRAGQAGQAAVQSRTQAVGVCPFHQHHRGNIRQSFTQEQGLPFHGIFFF